MNWILLSWNKKCYGTFFFLITSWYFPHGLHAVRFNRTFTLMVYWISFHGQGSPTNSHKRTIFHLYESKNTPNKANKLQVEQYTEKKWVCELIGKITSFSSPMQPFNNYVWFQLLTVFCFWLRVSFQIPGESLTRLSKGCQVELLC